MAVVTLTSQNFEAEVMQSDKPVLIDFWAAWCGPCRMVSPIVDEIGAEETSIKVGKVDVDSNPDLAQKFGVMSIPTLIVIKDGKVTQRVVGARPKAALKEMLGL
ncbi:MAG TPA: thioredoxin [Candidatus Limiplasma sp.]|nr:thioredoxin [Candidatus Limiplasma sp.]